ncbi:MAG: hypothetical protein KDC95_03495 [Planctomycetes bacterium]|nr:hypothetical protein [Planctomycetota bacterium]
MVDEAYELDDVLVLDYDDQERLLGIGANAYVPTQSLLSDYQQIPARTLERHVVAMIMLCWRDVQQVFDSIAEPSASDFTSVVEHRLAGSSIGAAPAQDLQTSLELVS